MSLADVIEPLAYDVAFWLATVEDEQTPAQELGEVAADASSKLRALGIVILLVHAEHNSYLHNLIRSANVRIVYLQRLRAAGIVDDHHQGCGWLDAFLDALAADEFPLACQVFDLARHHFDAGHEYLDDHHYGRSLRMMCETLFDMTTLQAHITALEAALKGRPSARVAVVSSLAHRDQVAFDDAFEALIDERAAQNQAAIDRSQFEDAVVVAERHMFVEGLAILRLAVRLGLSTESDYRFCPSIARLPMTQPFPGE